MTRALARLPSARQVRERVVASRAWAIGLFVVWGCTPGARPASSAPPRTGPASLQDRAWLYEARLGRERVLDVEARFRDVHASEFSLSEDTAAFVSRFEYARGETWVPAPERAAAWRVPCASSCKIRYRFDLARACASLAEADTAIAAGDALIAPPSTWLIHPPAAPGIELELRVLTEPGTSFVSGFRKVLGATEKSFHAPATVLDDATFAAFGVLDESQVPAGDALLQLVVAPHGFRLTSAEAQRWLADSAGAVANYYGGHLPARHGLVLLMQGESNDTHGLTLGGGGPGVLIQAAAGLDAATAREDWVLTHELLHANFPDLGREHAWLSEGLATYVEPIARARVGLVTESKLWRGMLDGMPQGLPEAGDLGLEHTRTWGRTYWGGALFCLIADVALRERTGNQRSLDDVLLAIGKASATDEDRWSMQQVLSVAERATGTRILSELYEALAEKPGVVDLAGLFARLGVRAQGASVVFDESAPLAEIRRSIAAQRPG